MYGFKSRGDIKMLTVLDLERLTTLASANPKWSAEGRPEWLREQGGNITTLMATVIGTEGRSVYRCLIVAVLADKSKCNFTLDVSIEDFNRLPDVPLKEVVTLAHKYLLGVPPLDLDPAQKESWRFWKNFNDRAD
ncbi:hypothetical protein [Spirillospora sp. NPDC048819]|uniref:hypothetical protein n=1 Tax=Spirillospora sp. NPDC048819 TaxID=3155268 RepID=UPI0033E436DE